MQKKNCLLGMNNKSSVYIEAQNLTVDFPTYAADRSLKRSIFRAATGGGFLGDSPKNSKVRALDGLDFQIQKGEKIGLYGHNGSGKTTLLRVLTGAYAPSLGSIEIKGRVSALLDLSLGISGDSTGWENILVRGLMLGLHKEEINKNMSEIADFSGLGSYLDMPVRTYSSGMNLRLAFSVSTVMAPDILLLDEWLSVGDDEFQKKATMRLEELIEATSILVIASHSIELLERTCTKIYIMEKGRFVRR